MYNLLKLFINCKNENYFYSLIKANINFPEFGNTDFLMNQGGSKKVS